MHISQQEGEGAMERSANILLVDDNPMDVELTLDAFREARLRNSIHISTNGQDALDYLFGSKEYSDRQKYPLPNLMLLDLKMQGVDGHEVLRQIKISPILKRLPVIILTSSKEEYDRARCYDNGANSFLVKPVSFLGFVEVIKKIDDYWFSLNIAPPEL
jgi:CheY-like chemotaxis protein